MKKLKKWPQNEAQLAEEVVAWFVANGWEVYEEVEANRSHGVADIVATLDGIIWIVECKTSFNLKVIAQADNWKKTAHYVSVAVPGAHFGRHQGSVPRYAAKVCEKLGIGVIAVQPQGYGNTYELVPAPLLRSSHEQAKILGTKLGPHLKGFGKAGAPGGSRWTPFKGTTGALIEVVKKNPGITMKDAIAQVKHHYRSSTGAIHTLAMHIRSKVIPELRIDSTNHKMQLYLNESTTVETKGPKG